MSEGLMGSGESKNNCLGVFYGSTNSGDGAAVTRTSQLNNSKSKLYVCTWKSYSNGFSISSGIGTKIVTGLSMDIYEYKNVKKNSTITISSYYSGGQTAVFE